MLSAAYSPDGKSIVTAEVPMAEMLTYGVDLTSMTQGRASFHMEFSHYEEVPRPVQEKWFEAQVALAEDFPDFLTLRAYDVLLARGD